MTVPEANPPGSRPDETFALIVVITGVLVLAGSEALHVVWLIVVGVGALVAFLRRQATRSDDETPPQ